MISKFSVARDSSGYLAWPDVSLTKSGKLVCVFSECAHHVDRSRARVMLCSSSDRGRSWTPKRPLTEETCGLPYYYNCARVSALRDGRLCVAVDRVPRGGEENVAGAAVNLLYFSSDEGETWSAPLETPLRGIVPDKLVELSSGRWLLAAHHPVDGFLAQYLRYSDDQGASWSEPVEVGRRAGLNLCEVSILAVDSLTLVAFMRENSLKGLPAFKAVSRDGGASWGALREYPIPGCHRPVAGLLRSGELLTTCRYQPPASSWIYPPRATFGSFKGGCQTTLACLGDLESALQDSDSACLRMLPIDFDRASASDTGYTGWVQFPDDEIYVVNYIVDDAVDKAQIRGYSLRLEDFVLNRSSKKS